MLALPLWHGLERYIQCRSRCFGIKGYYVWAKVSGTTMEEGDKEMMKKKDEGLMMTVDDQKRNSVQTPVKAS